MHHLRGGIAGLEQPGRFKRQLLLELLVLLLFLVDRFAEFTYDILRFFSVLCLVMLHHLQLAVLLRHLHLSLGHLRMLGRRHVKAGTKLLALEKETKRTQYTQ